MEARAVNGSEVRRVVVVAGEASGDAHAAGLVAELTRQHPGVAFAGVGGDAMRAEKVEIWHESSEIAVVGISEALERLPAIRKIFKDIARRLAEDPPSALLLVDLPDFNLRLAAVAARRGIPVVYFVSPQVWAWRKGRVRQIARDVTRMLVLFPFERDFYAEHGVDATFVGHPLAELEPAESTDAARERLGFAPSDEVYGLLPGSRSAEIERLMEPMLETARIVSAASPAARFVVPIAATVDERCVSEPVASSGLPVVALRGAFTELAGACDAAVTASGTATLELAALRVPSVVVYKVSASSFAIGKLFVRLPHFSLVNLVAEREVLPELIQKEFTPRRAAEELVALGRPGPVRDAALAGLDEVKRKLGRGGAYRRAAAALAEVLYGDGAGRGESA